MTLTFRWGDFCSLVSFSLYNTVINFRLFFFYTHETRYKDKDIRGGILVYICLLYKRNFYILVIPLHFFLMNNRLIIYVASHHSKEGIG